MGKQSLEVLHQILCFKGTYSANEEPEEKPRQDGPKGFGSGSEAQESGSRRVSRWPDD